MITLRRFSIIFKEINFCHVPISLNQVDCGNCRLISRQRTIMIKRDTNIYLLTHSPTTYPLNHRHYLFLGYVSSDPKLHANGFMIRPIERTYLVTVPVSSVFSLRIHNILLILIFENVNSPTALNHKLISCTLSLTIKQEIHVWI